MLEWPSANGRGAAPEAHAVLMNTTRFKSEPCVVPQEVSVDVSSVTIPQPLLTSQNSTAKTAGHTRCRSKFLYHGSAQKFNSTPEVLEASKRKGKL